MANTVISAAQLYSDILVKEPFIKSKFMILGDNSKFQFPLFGSKVLYRNVTAGNTAEYDPDLGFQNLQGTMGSATWEETEASFDRTVVAKSDTIAEANAVLQGMKLSTPEIISRTFAKIGTEIDAVTCSTIYNSIEASNKKTVADLPVDKDNIIGTLTKINSMMINAEHDGAYFIFMASSVYANLQDAMVANHIFGNQTSVVSFTGRDIFAGEDIDGLEAKIDVVKWGTNAYIIVVPDERMVTGVTLYDGKTEGQTAGGWVKATDAKAVKLVVCNPEAVAVAARHIVNNMTVPLVLANLIGDDINVELEGLAKIYNGAVQVNNIGVDQNYDCVRFMGRLVYSPVVFDGLKGQIFTVTEA